MKASQHIIDWTIVEAPDPDEAANGAGIQPEVVIATAWSATPRRGLPRRARVLIASVIVLVVIGIGAYTWWTAVATRLAIQQALTHEAQAVIDQDIEQIRSLYGAGDSDWDAAYTNWALSGQAAPRPLPFLYPLTTTGQLLALEPFASNVLRAEVARPFMITPGQVLTFTTTNFFAYTEDANAWQRIEPPANYWDEQRTYLGPYLTIKFWEPDQPLVDELGPFLDGLLTQSCSELDCPADYNFNLDLTSTLPNQLTSGKPDPLARPTDSLFFNMMFVQQRYSPEPLFQTTSPHVMGYPIDPSGLDLYRRAIGWQVLAQTIAYLGRNDTDYVDPLVSSIYFGLQAEMGARLSLDPAPTNEPVIINDLAALDWPGYWTTVSNNESENRRKFRLAQAVIHHLVSDEPPGTDARLLSALWDEGYDATNFNWLASGLNLTPDQAQARFGEALSDAIQIQSPIAGEFDWALTCQAGPAVLSLEDGALQYFLEDAHNVDLPMDGSLTWSPDDQRVLFGDDGFFADVSNGQVDRLVSIPNGEAERYTFITEDVLVYLYRSKEDSGTSLRFLNLRNPRLTPPAIENVWDYAVSPDRQWLAITRWTDADHSFRQANLSVMPAGGGQPVWEGQGVSPVWSSDSHRLAYTQYDAVGRLVAFHIFDFASGESKALWQPAPMTPMFGQNTPLAWSPTGKWFALMTRAKLPDHSAGTLTLLRPDGSQTRSISFEDQYAIHPFHFSTGPLHFSADGEFVAMIIIPSHDSAQLHLIQTATGEIVQTIDHAQTFEWSATGHQLAVAAADGLYWIPDPLTEPKNLSDDFCYSIAWNPTR